MSFIVRLLHSFKICRTLAKKVLPNLTIRQRFHNGYIFMNAVEHSWAWTGKRRYSSFDIDLQDKLLDISLKKTKFIDIGCNIGAMSLSVLLRNSNIKVVAIDPNKKALSCLHKSLKENNLVNRCKVIESIVANDNRLRKFDFAGSVTGHIASEGMDVQSIHFWNFIQSQSTNERLLVKIDIEGYETHLFKSIPKNLSVGSLTMVIELHPKGFNIHGNPNTCLIELYKSGFELYNFNNEPVMEVDENAISQIIANFKYDN